MFRHGGKLGLRGCTGKNSKEKKFLEIPLGNSWPTRVPCVDTKPKHIMTGGQTEIDHDCNYLIFT